MLPSSAAAWPALRPPGRRPRAGFRSRFYEMRPVRPDAVHKTDSLAELVCSNSFRGDKLDNAVGLLKEEMRRLGSLVMRAAESSRVPAGAALAVDRRPVRRDRDGSDRRSPAASPSCGRSHGDSAGDAGASRHRRHRTADLGRALVGDRPARRLRSSVLLRCHQPDRARRDDRSIDRVPAVALGSQPWRPAGRCGLRCDGPDRPEGDYLNCPLTRDEYARFYDALVHAESATVHDFDKERFFEGLSADRGHGAPRRRHAALRSDEAGRPRRSANRTRALCGRPAAAGQPGRRSLQPRRLPDAAEMGRAGPGAPADSGTRAGRVRPLRHGAPEHLRQRSDRARRRPGRSGRSRRCFWPARCRVSKGTSNRRPRVCSRAQRRAAVARRRRRRARRERRRLARSRSTCRTPTPRTTSRRTSRSASSSRWRSPPRGKMDRKLAMAERALADLERWMAEVERRGTWPVASPDAGGSRVLSDPALVE